MNSATMEQIAALPSFEGKELLERLDYDEAFVLEILEMCIDELDLKVLAIEGASASGDLAGIRELAHALKGVMANTSALRLSAIANELEMASQEERTEDVRALALTLRPEADQFKRAIAA
jgi:HPt (histidine-containing phosphotransfer) domain-containing protein